MKHLIEHQIVGDWIDRWFEKKDRTAALGLVAGLRLVSHQEFEAFIEGEIVAIAGMRPSKKRGKRRVALFPVTPHLKPADDAADENVVAKEVRREFDSSDRVGHFLSKLAESQPRVFTSAPTLASMRQEKVTDIVLVDDIIGSGRRVQSFWKSWAHKRTIRSWVSSGYCNLWLVAYCGSKDGIARVNKNVRSLHAGHTKIGYTLPPPATLWTEPVANLIRRYPSFSNNGNSGFDGGLCPVVFQHGCPNNSPYLLWAPPSRSWVGLFPGRSVPTSLSGAFESSEAGTRHRATALWNNKSRRMALKFLDHFEEDESSAEESLLVAVLGLIAGGVSSAMLPSVLIATTKKIDAQLKRAKASHLIDANGHITSFGLALTTHFTRRRSSRRPELVQNASPYYPRQYGGTKP